MKQLTVAAAVVNQTPPKTWCRFPILSGGFQRELGELHGR